jgi:hypothetical protein
MVVPWPGTKSFETILGMTSGLPVWVKADCREASSPEFEEALRMGAVGLWIDESLFSTGDPVTKLKVLQALVHVPVAV